VSDRVLTPRSGLEHLAAAGHHGVAEGPAGVTISLRDDLALASVMVRKGQQDALARRVRDAFGMDLPTSPKRVAAGPLALAWAGPGQWLAMAAGEGHALAPRLQRELAALASVTDQSDGRTVVRIAGPKAREALAKGVLIDLHPRAFGPGDTAVTSVAHVGAHFWQLDAVPSYEFAVFRSFAGAFWHWLIDSAAEFGVVVEDNVSSALSPPA
jgi:heterotetrameric sarcosine oxidase gamma subunit